MEMQKLLKPEYIFMEVTPLGAAREGALKSISRLLAKKCGLDERILLEGFLDREGLASTYLGDGIALPHARIPGSFPPIAAVVRFDRAVDWDVTAPYTVLAAVIFVIPETESNLYVDVLSAFARRLVYKEFCDGLKIIQDAEKLYQFILQEASYERNRNIRLNSTSCS